MAQATAKKSKSKPSSSKPSSHQQQRPSQPLDKQVAATLKRLQTRDPGLKQLLRDAFFYAVFPCVGKAALAAAVSAADHQGCLADARKNRVAKSIAQQWIKASVPRTHALPARVELGS